MEPYEFSKSLVVGEIGERVVENYLSQLENVSKVESVRDVREYQKKDIDFIVYMKNGRKFSVEVKSDSYKSGNLYYETKSCIELNTKGCFEKAEADFIFYYFFNLGKLYMLKTNKFRNWVRKEISMYFKDPSKSVLKEKIVANKTDSSETGIYNSLGYTIPLRYMEKKLAGTNVYKIITIEDMGKEVIKKQLLKLENIKSVDFINSFNSDVDLAIIMNNGKKYTGKISVDGVNGNILNYQKKFCVKSNIPGEFEKTKADYIFYYMFNSDTLYTFKTKKFRAWVNKSIEIYNKYPQKSPLKIEKSTDYDYKRRYRHTSITYKIPLNYIEDELKDEKIYKKYYNI